MSSRNQQKLRVAWDMTPLLGPLTGVGQMVRSLTSLLASDPDIDLSGFAVSMRGRNKYAEFWPEGAANATMGYPARVVFRLWKRFDFPRVTGFDVVHGPNFSVPPTGGGVEVVTIHDMTVWRWPELVHHHSLHYPAMIERALNRGAYVHTVSDFVAEEVRSHFSLAEDRVRAIGNGIDPVPPADARLGHSIAGTDTYVLAVGTIEPRKDYPTLLRAFNDVRNELPDLKLVVAGGSGWGIEEFESELKRLSLSDVVVTPGYVSDSERRGLMAGASAYCLSSVYEGFGLPPLEAMAYGVPVVATDAGAVPEVVGDAALLVPVGDSDQLAAKLSEVMSDSTTRVELRSRGLDNVERFSWAESAGQLKEWYLELSA